MGEICHFEKGAQFVNAARVTQIRGNMQVILKKVYSTFRKCRPSYTNSREYVSHFRNGTHFINAGRVPQIQSQINCMLESLFCVLQLSDESVFVLIEYLYMMCICPEKRDGRSM